MIDKPDKADKLPKRPRDTNQLAKRMVDILTGQVEDREPAANETEKDPSAAARGRLGGLKGGKARASSLTSSERSESAQNAARKRWNR